MGEETLLLDLGVNKKKKKISVIEKEEINGNQIGKMLVMKVKMKILITVIRTSLVKKVALRKNKKDKLIKMIEEFFVFIL